MYVTAVGFEAKIGHGQLLKTYIVVVIYYMTKLCTKKCTKSNPTYAAIFDFLSTQKIVCRERTIQRTFQPSLSSNGSVISENIF